jgi:hypothetical protein
VGVERHGGGVRAKVVLDLADLAAVNVLVEADLRARRRAVKALGRSRLPQAPGQRNLAIATRDVDSAKPSAWA